MRIYLIISGITLMVAGLICAVFLPWRFSVEHTFGTGPGAVTTVSPNVTVMYLGVAMAIIGFF